VAVREFVCDSLVVPGDSDLELGKAIVLIIPGFQSSNES
jgi:hypothetical protein